MQESIKSRLSENTITALSYVTFVPAIYFLIIPRYNEMRLSSSTPGSLFFWMSLLLSSARP